MKNLLLVFLFATFYSNVEPLDLNPLNIGKSTADVAMGVIGKIPDVIPKPEYIFQGGKNLIAGYPFEQAFTAINTFCEF